MKEDSLQSQRAEQTRNAKAKIDKDRKVGEEKVELINQPGGSLTKSASL